MIKLVHIRFLQEGILGSFTYPFGECKGACIWACMGTCNKAFIGLW